MVQDAGALIYHPVVAHSGRIPERRPAGDVIADPTAPESGAVARDGRRVDDQRAKVCDTAAVIARTVSAQRGRLPHGDGGGGNGVVDPPALVRRRVATDRGASPQNEGP